MKYKLIYYLSNQSELFSEPQSYETSDLAAIKEAVKIAKINGYKIVKLERI